MHNKTRKTRKVCKKGHRDCNKDAKKGISMKGRLKTCRAKKYKSVYGSESKGIIRSLRQLFY